MNPPVKVLFASGTDALIPGVISRVKDIFPDLPLIVVSEFQPDDGEWIPWHLARSFRENFALVRSRLDGRQIRLAAVIVVPKAPHRVMGLAALLMAPLRVAVFNENLDHFMLRPGSAAAIVGHIAWRIREFVTFETHPGGHVYTWAWRMRHPSRLRRPWLYRAALAAGVLAAFWKFAHNGAGRRRALCALRKRFGRGARESRPLPALPDGISVVIPSRNGRDLLARLLPGVVAQLDPAVSEIVVVDNGSSDATGEFLREKFPSIAVEHNDSPLSFARAVNRGIARARFSHVCLLNNDMVVEPDFFPALRRAFDAVPDLFAATAQIFFPEGQRREETGKAVMPPRRDPFEFPVTCEPPLEGEDLSYVLYGSGGCSL
ncbi:MAG: glycosyltransferase, partial [Bryobacteraceae bacterium]